MIYAGAKLLMIMGNGVWTLEGKCHVDLDKYGAIWQIEFDVLSNWS